jgi:hypothetical protein
MLISCNVCFDSKEISMVFRFKKSGQKEPKISFLYYGDSKTSHFGIGSKSLSLFKKISIFVVVFSLVFLICIVNFFSDYGELKSSLLAAKEKILKNEILHSRLFERTYDYVRKDKESGENQIIFKKQEIESNSFTQVKKSLEKINSISKDGLVVKNLDISLNKETLHLDFSLHNIEGKKTKEGYLWAVVVLKNIKNGKFEVVGLPDTISVDTKSLNPLDIETTHRYSIKNFLVNKFSKKLSLEDSLDKFEVVQLSVFAKNKSSNDSLVYNHSMQDAMLQ